MKHLLAWVILGVGLGMPAAAGSQPGEAPPPAEKAPPEQPAAEPEDPAERVERIVENAQAAGGRLGERDAGEETRRLQADVLRDIEALIRQAENPPQGDPQSSQGGQGGDPMGGGGASAGGGGASAGGGGGARGPGQLPGERGGMRPQPAPGGGSPSGRGEASGGPGGLARSQPGAAVPRPVPGGARLGPLMPAGGDPRESMNGPGAPTRLGDLNKGVWGHLPETLRKELDHYYRERFMPRYSDLLRQYYSSVAE